MPRKLRVEHGGAIYHVLSRSDRRKDIYLDDGDRQDYLKPRAEACQKTCFQGHAYSAGRRELEVRMETRRAAATAEQALQPLRRGWGLGSASFKQQMREAMEGRTGAHWQAPVC